MLSLLVWVCATVSPAHAVELKSADDLNITGQYTDMLLAGGETVTLALQSSDDVFAAGSEVFLAGAAAPQFHIIGSDVSGSEFEAGDLMVVTGDLNLTGGGIKDDLMATAGEMRLSGNLTIGGSALVSGGELTIEVAVGEDLRASGAEVRLNAEVGGDVYLSGNEIEVGPKTRIGGTLTHRGDNINISPQAQIAGGVVALDPSGRFEAWLTHVAIGLAFFGIALLIGLVVLVLVASMALPGLMNTAARNIVGKPLNTLGIGFLVVFIGPALIVLLAATVVGLPVAVLVVAFYAVAAMLAIAAAVYTLGLLARSRLTGSGLDQRPAIASRVLWTALAVIVVGILSIIPILGGLVWLVAYVFGMGAVLMQLVRKLAVEE